MPCRTLWTLWTDLKVQASVKQAGQVQQSARPLGCSPETLEEPRKGKTQKAIASRVAHCTLISKMNTLKHVRRTMARRYAFQVLSQKITDCQRLQCLSVLNGLISMLIRCGFRVHEVSNFECVLFRGSDAFLVSKGIKTEAFWFSCFKAPPVGFPRGEVDFWQDSGACSRRGLKGEGSGTWPVGAKPAAEKGLQHDQETSKGAISRSALELRKEWIPFSFGVLGLAKPLVLPRLLDFLFASQTLSKRRLFFAPKQTKPS